MTRRGLFGAIAGLALGAAAPKKLGVFEWIQRQLDRRNLTLAPAKSGRTLSYDFLVNDPGAVQRVLWSVDAKVAAFNARIDRNGAIAIAGRDKRGCPGLLTLDDGITWTERRA